MLSVLFVMCIVHALRIEETTISFLPSISPSQVFSFRFVDGKSYFEHVAHVMECAREEIFIGGWFITAELFMKRPVKGSQDPWQLANVLKRKAEQGVRIFVLFYKEFEKVSDNGSAWASRVLDLLHPRIHVLFNTTHSITL